MTKIPATQKRQTDLWYDVFRSFERVISELDIQAARARVDDLRARHPGDDTAAIIERLIRDACLRAGMVGAATASAASIPGLGTLTSLTVGIAADIGATFKIQAELVVAIAAARGRELTGEERRTVVLAVTGVSSGVNRVTGRATAAALERFAARWAAHALPVVGAAASGATNMLLTYLVGKRADAYLSLGPEAAGDWSEIVRAVSGVDERRVGEWFGEQSRTMWGRLHRGASGAGDALNTLGRAAGGVASGAAQSAGRALAGTSGAVVGAAQSAGRALADTSGAVVGAASALGEAAKGGIGAITRRVRPPLLGDRRKRE